MKGYEAPDYNPLVVGVLVDLRKKAGLSQFAVADKMGLTGGKRDETVGTWEAGKARPGAALRADFLLYLWDSLRLMRDPDGFAQVWRDVCIGQWQWPPLNEKLLHQAFGETIPLALLPLVRREAQLARLTAPQPDPLPNVRGFVGRESELARFTAQLERENLAVITGMPGMGKTSLAAVLAQRVAPGKVFWRRLCSDDDADTLLWLLAAFLQHQGQGKLWETLQAAQSITGKQSAAELYAKDCVGALSDQGYALWLDDLQLVEGKPLLRRLVERIVEAARAGKLRLIISSRVPPSFIAVEDLQPLQGLRSEDAVLFVLARRPDLGAVTAERLRERTEGNPQLLALAVNALGRADDREAMLTQLDRDPNVHRYLLDQVNRTLSRAEQEVMVAAACFERGATGGAIAAALGDRRAQSILDDLATRNLLQATPKLPHWEYAQHAIIRAFYEEQASGQERKAMHGRVARHYELIERNMLAASEHYLAAGERVAAARLLTEDLWEAINLGHSGRLRELLEGLRSRQVGPVQWVAVNIALGQVHAFARDVEAARSRYDQAYALTETLQDGAERAVLRAQACRCLAGLMRSTGTHEALGWVRRSLGELAPYETGGPAHPTLTPELAFRVQREAAALRVEAGFAYINMAAWTSAIALLNEALARLPLEADALRAGALMNLGIAYCTQGKPAIGIPYYERALEMARECSDVWRVVSIRHNLAIERELAGEWAKADAEYVDALTDAERIHASIPEQGLTLALGILSTKQGRLDRAEGYLRKATDMARRYDLGRHLAASLSSLADLLVRQGDTARAAPLLEEAQSLAERMDAGDRLAEIERNWAQVHLAQGDIMRALDAAERSLILARKLELEQEAGITLRVKGEALTAQRQIEKAGVAFVESLKRLEGHDPYEAARTRLAWGRSLLGGSANATRGRALLVEAQSGFVRLGADHDAALVQETLRQAGPRAQTPED